MASTAILVALSILSIGLLPVVAQGAGAPPLNGLDACTSRSGETTEIWPEWIGAGSRRDVPTPGGRRTAVGSIDRLREVLAAARPGDNIVLDPGLYCVSGAPLVIAQPGLSALPITLRAATFGTVVIASTVPEAIKVSAPNWHLENLTIRGACPDHSNCDHAFHMVGAAERTVIDNVWLEDFNAAIKINGEGGRFPDNGVIENSTLVNHAPRHTANSVTPIDLVAASGWRVAGNLIADFVKDGGDGVSYGAFAKGGGTHNIFARNVVLCMWHLRAPPGARVGLSLGGGGTGAGFGREPGPEQRASAIRDNLIAFCDDVGIYLNSAPASVVTHNTLISTEGIDVRFPETFAEISRNLVAGRIRIRDGASMQESDNLTGKRVSSLFENAPRLDLRWRENPTRTGGNDTGVDLCGVPRPSRARLGAFEAFEPCLAAGGLVSAPGVP